MSSRQINFYLTPSDQEKLEEAFHKAGDFTILRDTAELDGIVKLKDMKISNMKDIKNEPSNVYLTRAQYIKDIVLRTIEGKNYRTFDEFRSPIIQFDSCRYIDGVIRRGRMYVINSWFEDTVKEESFLKWSSNLFKIARRSLIKENNSFFYYGAEAWQLKETGGADFRS